MGLPLVVLVAVVAMAGGRGMVGSAAEEEFVVRMAREHAGDSPAPSPLSQTPPATEVLTEEVVYATLDGRPIKGYLARPSVSPTPLPAVLLIHEWWGLNENIQAMARRLAGEGYLALAVDLYEGDVAEDREEASRLARTAAEKTERLEENLRQAHRYLQEARGASRIGVIGWCFGGGWALRTALLLGDDIDAAVIYYGRLVMDPEELRALQAPVLGIFGALDRGIPVSTVREFEAVLQALGKEASIHIYEGADHAFANPSGGRYHAEAAADAWEKTVAFFSRHL